MVSEMDRDIYSWKGACHGPGVKVDFLYKEPKDLTVLMLKMLLLLSGP